METFIWEHSLAKPSSAQRGAQPGTRPVTPLHAPVWYSTRSFKCSRSEPYVSHAGPARARSAVRELVPSCTLDALYPGQGWLVFCRGAMTAAPARGARRKSRLNMVSVRAGMDPQGAGDIDAIYAVPGAIHAPCRCTPYVGGRERIVASRYDSRELTSLDS